jgi:hypothetical protein
MLTLVSLSLQVIAKVVCKTERQSLVRLVKYAETGIRPQHVCKGRMYSVNETNQVERQDPIRAFGLGSPMLTGKNDNCWNMPSFDSNNFRLHSGSVLF